MTETDSKDGPATVEGVSGRTVMRTAAGSVPVLASAISTPLAAASAGVTTLTFAVDANLDIHAPAALEL